MKKGSRPHSSYYEERYGSFYLLTESSLSSEPTILSMVDEISIAFVQGEDEPLYMLKHGSTESLAKWAKSVGHQAIGGPIQILTLPKAYPLSEVNRLLESSGYLPEFIRRAVEWKPSQ